MNALAIGLDENTEFNNLETRIRQIEYLAKKLDEYGIPYQLNPEKPDVPLNKNDAFQKVQKRRVQEKR
jgi:tryptophanase